MTFTVIRYNRVVRKQTKLVILSLVILSIFGFVFFSIPNTKASENLAMITMFEPDESTMLPVVKRMIHPQPNLIYTIGRFVAYGFYSYGFPLYAPSGMIYKALTVFGQGENYPLIMLVMRQLISVIPMLASLWILVYLQDQFKTWRSIALFILLLSVPAVIQNGFWWHPDGLVMLFSSLVLYFLWKDNRTFGKQFYLAAVLCGVLIALKVVGLFFFLTIAMVVIWGLAEKQLTWKQFFIKGFLFILIMAVSILAASPHLLIPNHRILALNVFKKEFFETSQGYGIVYDKGLQAAWFTITAFYGKAIFLIITLAVSVWSLWDKETRFLRALILSWLLPLSVYLLFFSHFKYQYWLPVAIPLISNLAFLIQRNEGEPQHKPSFVKYALLVIVLIQFVLFFSKDLELFTIRNNRKENSPAIRFYDQAVVVLAPVTQELKVYYDYRLYMPDTPAWTTETSFDLLTYQYIQSGNFDILFLEQQRTLDYIQEGVVGIDPETFPLAQAFYRDANDGNIEGYDLLVRDESALLFIKEDLCSLYFDDQRCQ